MYDIELIHNDASAENTLAYYQGLCDDDKVIDREFGAYKGIEDNYPKYVFSMDKHDFSQDGIIHKNVIDWLLEE